MVKILEAIQGQMLVLFRDNKKIILPMYEVPDEALGTREENDYYFGYDDFKIFQTGKKYFFEYKEEKKDFIKAVYIGEAEGPAIIVRANATYWYDGKEIREVPIATAASIYLSKKPRVFIKKSMEEEWKRILNKVELNT